MKDEALKLALEALDGIHPGNMTPMAEEYWNKAITAIKQARALDKMAENARELGLDYEPVAMPENWFAGMPEEYRKEAWRVATPPAGQPAPVQEPVAFKQFLSDIHTAAGLVTHGKQCKALGERLSEGVMRYYMATSPAAQPAVPPVVQNICIECANADSWGLPDKPACRSCISNSEWSPLNRSSVNPITPPAAQPAIPDALFRHAPEHPQYIEGWNDCRAEMLKGMKP
jgi:hypothetical protein